MSIDDKLCDKKLYSDNDLKELGLEYKGHFADLRIFGKDNDRYLIERISDVGNRVYMSYTLKNTVYDEGGAL
jgi:hypothetical protein